MDNSGQKGLFFLKIAMIGHKLFPSRSGGVEVAVEALAMRMAAAGHHVTVYNRGRNPDCAAKFHNGVRIRSVPVVQKQGIAAVMGSFLATLHAVFCGFDCIHYHAEGPAAFVWIPHLLGKRTVVTIHGLDWQRSKWGRFASWYLQLGEKNAARFADEVIVLSEAVQEYFRTAYGRETTFLPNGVNEITRREPDQIQSTWNLETEQYILYLGRLVPEKGVQYLIDAFRQTNTDKQLIIAGNADSEEFGDALKAAAAGDERIRFIGFVQGQILEELFSNCYLYCLPSDLEGMPISLLEALCFGCCCVSSDIPENAQLLSHWGFLFSKSDTESLRRVLQNLCDNPDTVKQCRKHVRRDFSHPTWDEVTEKTLELYRGTH